MRRRRFVGFSVILAGSFITIFRIWDAVTDVGMGLVVDRANTTPYSESLFAIGLLGTYGLALIGLIINVICLRFYDLSPERMTEIRNQLAERKGK